MKSSENSTSSSSAISKNKKKPSPRNPLRDLNSTCVNPRVSGEPPRGGCFSFFSSNSSSSRPQSRTPKTAPPITRALAPKNPRKASNLSSENPRFLGASGRLKDEENQRRPGSKDPILGGGYSSKGKCSNPSFNFEVDLVKNGCFSSTREKGFVEFKPEFSSKPSILGTGYVMKSENTDLNIRIDVDWEKNRRFLGENTTPEKSLIGISPEFDMQIQGKERKLPNTPNSNTTPPIQASISPEIGSGSNLEPTPVCFAAGHVIAGVHDRRKCRPRGILTVGEGCGVSDELLISSAVPPVAEASIQWLSSPSENVGSSYNFKVDEASVNWFVCPSNDVAESGCRSELDGPRVTPSRIRDSSDHGFWRFSPTSSNTSKSPNFKGLLGLSSPDFETTPSSGNDIRRTPTSGSSISPFSAIVKRASGFKYSRLHEERGGYRYGGAVESTPVSGESWVELNGTSMPSSYSRSMKKGKLSPFNLDSMAEVFGSMRLSPKKDACDLPPPLADLSFQFACPGTPSNSIDLACFKKPSGDGSHGTATAQELCAKDKDLSGSELRISWRDGLVSRIFEMGELDCCQCLSDDEDNVKHYGEERIESKFDSKNKSLVLKEEYDKDIQNGSASFEFPFSGFGVQESVAKILPPGSSSCAESFSTDGGLIASADSDWTLFYKNHLFEAEVFDLCSLNLGGTLTKLLQLI